MTLVPHSVVIEVIYDRNQRKATGVRVIHAETQEVTEYYAPVIFLNASTIATTAILLNSKSEEFPDGLGNSSGQLGHNLMDHFIGVGAEGEFDGYQDQYYYGRTPNCIYIPRFRNIDESTKQKEFIRGYGYQGKGERLGWREVAKRTPGFGADFKKAAVKPGPWKMWVGAWGETLPYFDNQVTLDPSRKDQWGMPLVSIDFEYRENERAMKDDAIASISEMLEVSGFKRLKPFDYPRPGGAAVHEMGTARMGHDPKTSVLNKFNQLHDAPNVFVTDGSCMTSAGSQSPSLTYMALTARAVDYAVSESKKGNL